MPTQADLSAVEEALCKDDPLWMIERHFVIHNKRGQLQLLYPLRDAQKRAMAVVNYFRARNKPVRLIVGKSRKKGLSTIFCADSFCEYLSRDINVMMIAHEKELSEKLLDIIHRYYNYLDRPFDPEIPPVRKPPLYKGQSSKDEIRFEGYEGRMWIGTARNVYAGTGLTPQYLFCSEVSKWDTGATTAISLLQSVASMPGTSVVMECTFNGEDPLFFPYWKAAYENSKLTFGPNYEVTFEVTNPEKWNYFVPLFTGTSDDPDAHLPFDSDADKARFETTLDEYEKMIRGKFDISLESLNWRRMTLKMQCQNRIEILNQEYPYTPEEAIISTGYHRFDVQKLNFMRQKYREDGERGELSYGEKWTKRILWNRDGGGMWLRFRKPVPNHQYVIGVDTAEGKRDTKYGGDPDATVVSVHDIDANMEQVCIIYGAISAENITDPILITHQYYNNAFVVPERTPVESYVCTELPKICPQEYLYHSGDIVHEFNRSAREVGWRTTGATKSRMIGWLAQAIEEGAIIFHCEKTFEELIHYWNKPGGGTEASPGYHDDHVIAVALAEVGARSRPVMLDKRNPDSIERYYQLPKDDPRRPSHPLGGYA